MKTRLVLFLALLSLSMITVSSCIKDEDNENPDNGAAFIKLQFTYKATQSMIDYCDIVVTYSDGTIEKTDTIKADEWNDSEDLSSDLIWIDSVITGLPAVVSFTRNITVKKDIDLAQIGGIYCTKDYNFKAQALNADMEKVPASFSTEVYLPGFSFGESDYESLKENGQLKDIHIYYFNKNGYLTDANGDIRR